MASTSVRIRNGNEGSMDILERLSTYTDSMGAHPRVCLDARTEIERMRAALENISQVEGDTMVGRRARAALEQSAGKSK